MRPSVSFTFFSMTVFTLSVFETRRRGRRSYGPPASSRCTTRFTVLSVVWQSLAAAR
jgi:hypothetical protein